MNRIFVNTKAVEKIINNTVIKNTRLIIRKTNNLFIHDTHFIFTGNSAFNLSKRNLSALEISNCKHILINKCSFINRYKNNQYKSINNRKKLKIKKDIK